MKNNIMYKQCILTRKNEVQTAWLPSKYAKVGIFLKINEQNGWKVESVGSELVDADKAVMLSLKHKNHRKTTDDDPRKHK